MDITDHASELEEATRLHAIARATTRRLEDARYGELGQRLCLSCDEPISPVRIQLVDAKRCVDCQAIMEQQGARYGR